MPEKNSQSVANRKRARVTRIEAARLKYIAWRKRIAADKAWEERAEQEQQAWLRRPRLHTAKFEKLWRDEQIARLVESSGAKTIHNIPIEQRRRDEADKREVEELVKNLGWSNDRFALFTKLVVEYRRDGSIENYLRVRREFPEVEIQVGRFAGMDPVFALEEEFKRQGVDPHLVAAALDSDEPSIDALSLRLLELLVARDKLPKDGPGHIEARRNAISDATVNFLVTTMLEGYDWHDDETFRVPASLVVLVRHLLCGSKPDLYAAYRSKEQRKNTAFLLGQMLKPGEKLSVGKLVKMVPGISRAMAARWLASEDFGSWIQLGANTLLPGSELVRARGYRWDGSARCLIKII
jgi:hypothetical protein